MLRATAKIIEVIHVTYSAGCGNPNPDRSGYCHRSRVVEEYYTTDGRLIARDDPCEEEGGA